MDWGENMAWSQNVEGRDSIYQCLIKGKTLVQELVITEKEGKQLVHFWNLTCIISY